MTIIDSSVMMLIFLNGSFAQVYGGDAHFDDAEMWTINSRRGTNLFQVIIKQMSENIGLELGTFYDDFGDKL